MNTPKRYLLVVALVVGVPVGMGMGGVGWNWLFSGIPVSGATFAVENIEASHPAVVSVQSAIDDGSAFSPGFLCRPSTDSEVEWATMMEQNALSLAEFRSALPAEAEFSFQKGAEFRIKTSKGSICTVIWPMEGETLDHPSMFRLATGANQQVYLLFSVRNTQGVIIRLHFLVWNVGGKWKAVSMVCLPASTSAITASEAFNLAEAAVRDGKDLLALALYSAAAKLSGTPPYRTSGLQQRLQQAIQPLNDRLRIGRQPIESLATAGDESHVWNVQGVPLQQGLFVELSLRVRELAPLEQLKIRQEAIAVSFLAKYPSFREHFDGVSVGHMSTHGSDSAGRNVGYRSIFRGADLARKVESE